MRWGYAMGEGALPPWSSNESDSPVNQGWKTGFLRTGPLLLEYKTRKVEGKPWLFFLHGYGQDYRCFDPVYERAGMDYSFLALNLPFHGESSMEQGFLRPEHWLEALEELFSRTGCRPLRAIAFSMGAKFLLLAAEKRPEWFEELILLAPDGLVKNPWYRFATGTAFGRFILRAAVRLIPGLKGLLHLLVLLKILRSGMTRFALSALADEDGRSRLLKVWIGFRKIWPDLDQLRARCRGKLKITVYLARYDSIIPSRRFRLLKNRESWIQWKTEETGHSGLIAVFSRKF